MSGENASDSDSPEHALIEVSTLAVKIKARVSKPGYTAPQNSSELCRRFKTHLLTLAEMTTLIPVTVVVGAVNLVGGVCSAFTRPARQDFEHAAEQAEGKRREGTSELEITKQSGGSHTQLQEPDLENAIWSVRDLLNQLRQKGLHVETRKLSDGRIALMIVPHEELSATEQLLATKLIPRAAVEETLTEQSTLLDRSVSDLDLPLAGLGALHKAGVRTIRELISLSAKQLLEIDGFGETSLDAVRRELFSIGQMLDGD